jgi:hypothetical protein
MRLTVPPGRDLRGFADATVTGARKRPGRESTGYWQPP